MFIPCSPKSLNPHISTLGFTLFYPNLALPTTFCFPCIISVIPGECVCMTHISKILRKMQFFSPSAVTQIRVSVISATTSSSVGIRRAQTICFDLLLNMSAVAQDFSYGYVWKSSTDQTCKKKDFNLDPDSSHKFYSSSELDLSLLTSSFLRFQRVGGKGSPKDSCRASEVQH